MDVAIVTGVSRGLGEAIAAALLADGVSVLGVGRASAARLSGDRYRFIAVDFASVDAIDATLDAPFSELAQAHPAHACLVNNAATAEPVGTVGSLTAAVIAASLAVNLAAPAAIADVFCRRFGALAGERRIVNVSSGAAVRAIPGAGLYSVAKAGLEMLTQAIAAEQGAEGIRCVTLRPGILDTPMQAFMRAQPQARVPSVDMFKGFHAGGQLVAPDVAAAKIVRRIVRGPIEQGRTYSYAEL
jgi:NAD(P)-dependent dehydrogenase (short-subunit alcohol dehydrogenase family)